MASKIKLIRTAYLYIASLVSLLFIAIGAYTLLNTAIKAYILPQAEKGGFGRCTNQPPVYSVIEPDRLKQQGIATEEQKQQLEMLIQDYENWKKENTGEECYKAERQKNVADAITMIVIALPIFAFHWRMVQKEKDKE